MALIARLKLLTPAEAAKLPEVDKREAQTVVRQPMLGRVLRPPPPGAVRFDLRPGEVWADEWDESRPPPVVVPGESAYLVLCGRSRCGERLGYVKDVSSSGTDGQRISAHFYPRHSFILRDGTWQLSKRAQRQYARQLRVNERPKDRRLRTPLPGRSRRRAEGSPDDADRMTPKFGESREDAGQRSPFGLYLLRPGEEALEWRGDLTPGRRPATSFSAKCPHPRCGFVSEVRAPDRPMFLLDTRGRAVADSRRTE